MGGVAGDDGDFDPTEMWFHGSGCMDDDDDLPLINYFSDLPCTPLYSTPSASIIPTSSSEQPSSSCIDAAGAHQPPSDECFNIEEWADAMLNLEEIDRDPSSVFLQTEIGCSRETPAPSGKCQPGSEEGNGELTAILTDWLKKHKNQISGEDLKRIVLKKSAVENGLKDFGTGIEGKKKLLKLILEWIDHSLLRQKKTKTAETASSGSHAEGNDNIAPNFITLREAGPTTTFSYGPTPTWAPDSAAPQRHVFQPSPPQGGSGVYSSYESGVQLSCAPLPHSMIYHNPGQSSAHLRPPAGNYPTSTNMAVESGQWPKSLPPPPRPFNPRCNKRPFITLTPKHEALEARKNRTMARQIRNLRNASANMSSAQSWPQPSTAQSSPEEQPQGSVTVSSGVEFVLQKVLKPSDVQHGRIVLPKREAEFRLPQLDSRLGISIPMEDMCISRVWDFKYRFWQNDRSKMYVLENTGEFVCANELQEGDSVFIYADTRSGKYLIRGVKEVQPSRPPATTNLSTSSSAAASFLPVTDE